MRTVAHISDVHFGRSDPALVDAVVADINGRRPSVVVVSGDLTQRARRWQFERAAEFLARLPKPLIVVPGNHDVPLYDLFRRFFGTLQFYQRHISIDLSPVHRDEEMLVMGLNTTRPFSPRWKGFWKDGRVSRQQMEEIRSVFGQAPASLCKIIVTHHPFIPPSLNTRGEIIHGATEALAVMEQCGVDLLLAGHLHLGYFDDVRSHHEKVRRSILSVQAGTATSTRRRGAANAYNWITIRPNDVAIEVRAWDGSRFSMLTDTRFVRTAGVWQRQA